LLVAAVGAAGCAHRTARNATESVAQTITEMQQHAPAAEQIVRTASTRAVEGAVDALDDPAQQARIRKIVNAAVADAVATALRTALSPSAISGEVATSLDGEPLPSGRGPVALLAGQVGRAATADALGQVAVELGGDGDLRKNLVATGAIATDAAVGAMLGELFPECAGVGPAAADCRRDRMQALTRATAASFSAGVRDSFRWPLLFLAAVVGLSLGALAHWAITLRRRPRHHAFRPV
jgi:hypothetical protein